MPWGEHDPGVFVGIERVYAGLRAESSSPGSPPSTGSPRSSSGGDRGRRRLRARGLDDHPGPGYRARASSASTPAPRSTPRRAADAAGVAGRARSRSSRRRTTSPALRLRPDRLLRLPARPGRPGGRAAHARQTLARWRDGADRGADGGRARRGQPDPAPGAPSRAPPPCSAPPTRAPPRGRPWVPSPQRPSCGTSSPPAAGLIPARPPERCSTGCSRRGADAGGDPAPRMDRLRRPHGAGGGASRPHV